MATQQETEHSGTPEYELLPTQTDADDNSTPPLMVSEDMEEDRQGDTIARHAALIFSFIVVAVTWTITLTSRPSGWFALHPPLQSLALLLFTFGIITLQPTNKPKTKAVGLTRHQIFVFLLAFPVIIFGIFAAWYNKFLRDAQHFKSWHGVIGVISMLWLIFQVILGGGSVWYGGWLFGGGVKAKALWKYHRLSGYLLFPVLLFSTHLGGAWSSWGAKHTIWIIRFIAYTVAPLGILIGVYTRIRTFKMKIFEWQK
ncbi:hypothetical protein NLJ89_g1418 [Agrocybe chaxingu]|uniref:Cytochrome b561 domain-containing protein n=1 Tax=Agrocybe chaxingu TaxID=84603 RepID=A0A9W8N019_9AGAR|nr:hypothetical protein NLJ89_g1418 [Agrocybe chaxingu]